MLELLDLPLRVLRCSARPSTLTLIDDGRWLLGRIAPDELLLVVPPAEASSTLTRLRGEVAATGGLAVDHTDAFRIIALSGDVQAVLARLTAIHAPVSGFIQGLIAEVPCKAFLAPDRLLLLAPSTHDEHVRQRVSSACRGLRVIDEACEGAVLPPMAAS